MIKRSNLFGLCQWSSTEYVENVYKELINNIYTHFLKEITSELNYFVDDKNISNLTKCILGLQGAQKCALIPRFRRTVPDSVNHLIIADERDYIIF